MKCTTVLGFLVLSLVGIAVSCAKEEVIPYNKPDSKLMPVDPTEQAIYHIRKEYQTKIIYRYDRRYLAASAFAAPPEKDLVLPYIENVVRKLFIAPYERQKSDFMREHMPIEIILFGTSIGNYVEGGENNFSASGVAAGLTRITLTGINSYNPNSRSYMQAQHATFHHEMAHILTKIYGRPKGFDNVSKGLYAGGASYNSFSLAEVRNRGFWRNYGMINENEDFATWVDGIVTTPKQQMLDIVAANNLLSQKYQMIYNFYLDKGIDIHVLQEYLQSLIDKLEEE
ncbi:substrate import-associated zinc metallohydrolase lipoprotein [Sphingobacterium paucimobilis]|uniref:Substrate import-associated zinc metallohydrolase lipoprotein n=1 Tax=Sphingobacterium paucimobilis HER1398 TaxID=1346330 RepID=U2JB51_9SPHI|nr:substrate import-associated zinc metallohydrolase lipoprotein [Sphingobacterium paucimobilis]ERJ59893.1 hypothetical protein M472_14065 [Sphingobacterium paucimobilis HER1398]